MKRLRYHCVMTPRSDSGAFRRNGPRGDACVLQQGPGASQPEETQLQ